MTSSPCHPGATYEIQVQGQLDRDWAKYLGGLAIRFSYARGQSPVTTLVGTVADQAALRGLLCKLWDLNLTLISLRRSEAHSTKEEADD